MYNNHEPNDMPELELSQGYNFVIYSVGTHIDTDWELV